ncbi:hypothetical protein EG329_004794 [Mollisiaceae sp. DMI_Dod_QoI]|nr:hypothetical protein EG329_004794 [Helotiales sp. DMI_Dod_QoI]
MAPSKDTTKTPTKDTKINAVVPSITNEAEEALARFLKDIEGNSYAVFCRHLTEFVKSRNRLDDDHLRQQKNKLLAHSSDAFDTFETNNSKLHDAFIKTAKEQVEKFLQQFHENVRLEDHTLDGNQQQNPSLRMTDNDIASKGAEFGNNLDIALRQVLRDFQIENSKTNRNSKSKINKIERDGHKYYEKSLEKSQWTLVALLKELHSAEINVNNIAELVKMRKNEEAEDAAEAAARSPDPGSSLRAPFLASDDPPFDSEFEQNTTWGDEQAESALNKKMPFASQHASKESEKEDEGLAPKFIIPKFIDLDSDNENMIPVTAPTKKKVSRSDAPRARTMTHSRTDKGRKRVSGFLSESDTENIDNNDEGNGNGGPVSHDAPDNDSPVYAVDMASADLFASEPGQKKLHLRGGKGGGGTGARGGPPEYEDSDYDESDSDDDDDDDDDEGLYF